LSSEFDKGSCFERAKKLLATGDDSVLRYACLELRFCLEAVTYDKLRTYAKRLPKEVLDKWQPPQAVRALLEFEPLADQDFTLRFARESEPGVPTGEWKTLGTHRTFKLSWLRKTYNKLGNFLHVPTLASQASGAGRLQRPETLRAELEAIVQTLEPIVASTLDASLANVIDFKCSGCGDLVLCNRDGVEKTRRAVCLNPNCGAEFAARQNEAGEITVSLMATLFPCGKCGHETSIENRKLHIGYCFSCEKCGEEHELQELQWGYGLVKESEGGS
jgi:hypothetical protein